MYHHLSIGECWRASAVGNEHRRGIKRLATRIGHTGLLYGLSSDSNNSLGISQSSQVEVLKREGHSPGPEPSNPSDTLE